jgi:hypothetical protein
MRNSADPVGMEDIVKQLKGEGCRCFFEIKPARDRAMAVT